MPHAIAGLRQLLTQRRDDHTGAAREPESDAEDTTLESMFAYQAEVEATASIPRQRRGDVHS